MMIPATIEEEAEKPGTATATADEKPATPKIETAQPWQQTTNTHYKSHSLAAGYWGDTGASQRPLRKITQSEASAVFLHGLLDTPADHPHHKRGDVFISVALHLLIVATILTIPLLFTRAIDLHQFAVTYLTAPPVPAAPPPPPPAVAQAVRPPKMTQLRPSVLTAPSAIPKHIEIVKESAPPTIDMGGVVGGMPGGETGGLLGGLLGGTGHVATIPPPAPPAAKQVYRIGGQVKPPKLITQVPPQYPLIAKKAHVQGVVIIDAIIDENGDVTQARAVKGPGLLFQAALQAVSQWKYEPTYLNGIAVPLELEVDVTFHLLSTD
jgi:periplasmic protein TonB